MNAVQVELTGTLQADGTLILDQKPALPAGRVRVVVQPVTEAIPPPEDWWQFMQRARRELEEAGSSFMNDAEMQAHIDWLREGDAVDELLQQAEGERGK